jgi:ketosteroid isomerase-like protein
VAKLILIVLPQVSMADPFEKLRQEWAHDLHEKRVEAATALYAPDAAFIRPDGARVKGSAAIRRLYEKVTSTFDSNLNFLSERVEISGDLAYDSGTYTETLVTRTTHKSILSKGSYLTIYRRGKDGNWKIVEQMWLGRSSVTRTSNPPASVTLKLWLFDTAET